MKNIFVISLVIFLTGCATHPRVSTDMMKKGETEKGLVFSLENIIPVYNFRYGLTDRSNIGLRIGIPIYGSGIDYSRLLYARERKWDVLNLSWSLNPNYNIDATYYKFYRFKTKGEKPPAVFWWALRMMYIPRGVMGKTSNRFGLLLGIKPWPNKGFEIGYFHDSSAMPLAKVFSPSWRWDSAENIARYGDKPHIAPSGMPSEFSRLTGISFQFFVDLNKPEPVSESTVSDD